MALSPPIVENKSPAQITSNGISIPFLMNKTVGWDNFEYIALILKTVQSSTQLAFLTCEKKSLVYKDGKYWGNFQYTENNHPTLKIGQYYKVQLAYGNGDIEDKNIGFYSNTTSFKYTSEPIVYIQNLEVSNINRHLYNYTGVYENPDDPSEKVYSYRFDLYNDMNILVTTSGDLLHNASKDTETNRSIDEWFTRTSLQDNHSYSLRYSIKTINGLEYSSPLYRIIDNQTVESNIFKYCDFVATKNIDSAYVELSLQPKSDNTTKKYISGQFILLRSSSEDNFGSWHELTKFILTSHSVLDSKFICRDYCVSQGVQYNYALQAYNNQGLYSARKEIKNIITMDFEDMFLTDKDRQLKIRFNPKVTSFKNTILESKMDTLGGKYPFFFRNGNVNYKEFPISGLISMLTDESAEFMSGVQLSPETRTSTPSQLIDVPNLAIQLTGDNFRKERDFKMEVLAWLTNGEPKLFRSPGEGSFIVRLMNTSLTPNDTLGRMLHTFNSTAYEIADFNFENLRKFGMMVDDYVELRELEVYKTRLDTKDDFVTSGKITGINACTATLHTKPDTVFRCRLKSDEVDYRTITVGNTGIFEFPKSVLAENELIEICPPAEYEDLKSDYWPEDTWLIYSTYKVQGLTNFSHIHSIDIEDKILRIIGKDENEIDNLTDKDKILKTVGQVYYLNASARPIIPFEGTVSLQADGSYLFIQGGKEYTPNPEEIVRHREQNGIVYYYDGLTSRRIGTKDKLDYNLQLRNEDQKISMQGINMQGSSNIIDQGASDTTLPNTGGRFVLTNIANVDLLYMGNAVYADIAYQQIFKTYTIELEEGRVKEAKSLWEITKQDSHWSIYYNALKEYLNVVEEDLILDAI